MIWLLASKDIIYYDIDCEINWVYMMAYLCSVLFLQCSY